MPGNQEIKGNTLKVYLYLVKHGSSDLKDIQHGLGLSSASLGSYHLGKLSEAGMVTQDAYGKYSAIKDASDKILEGYSKVGPAIVPQLFFFSLLFTILVVFFSVALMNNPSFTPYLVAISIAMIAVLWVETLRLWRRLSV